MPFETEAPNPRPPEPLPRAAGAGARGFEATDVWIFDLDNTLYPARCNLFAQIDVRIGAYIADWLKVTPEQARVVPLWWDDESRPLPADWAATLLWERG